MRKLGVPGGRHGLLVLAHQGHGGVGGVGHHLGDGNPGAVSAHGAQVGRGGQHRQGVHLQAASALGDVFDDFNGGLACQCQQNGFGCGGQQFLGGGRRIAGIAFYRHGQQRLELAPLHGFHGGRQHLFAKRIVLVGNDNFFGAQCEQVFHQPVNLVGVAGPQVEHAAGGFAAN